MDETNVRSRLGEIFRDIFDDETIQIHDAMTARDLEDWDSLTHVNLIVATEKAFDISFTTKEVQSLRNVGEFVQMILRKVS